MYEDGKAVLIQRVRAMVESVWAPTCERKQAQAISEKLRGLVDLLDGHGVVQFDIEQAHDAPLPEECGQDGYPIPAPAVGCSYKATLMHMRALAATAEGVADSLPSAQQKHAAPFAALVFLHLRYRHGYPRPPLHDGSDEVCELKRILSSAGIELSNERVRGLLSKARQEFDPNFFPYHDDGLLG
jgi:hypothetical protein